MLASYTRGSHSRVLVKHRWEVGAGRLVIEADGHQGKLMHEAQAVCQTPAKQLAIARRQQKPASGESRGGADQRLQTLVSFGYCVREECDIRGIGRHGAEMLGDARRSLTDRILKLAAAMMAVNALTQRIAG